MVAVIVAFAVGIGAGILVAPHLSSQSQSGSSAGQTLGRHFNSSAYISSSFYLISGNAIKSPAYNRVTGDLNLTSVQLANGATEYMMNFGSGVTYNVTIDKGDNLYYIDTSFGDDNPSYDAALGDDGYAVINSTGYLITYKYPLPNT